MTGKKKGKEQLLQQLSFKFHLEEMTDHYSEW